MKHVGEGAGRATNSKRKYPVVDAVQAEDVQRFLPEVCLVGVDGLPLGATGERVWNRRCVKVTPERLIKLAWETALAKSCEDQCVRLLLSGSGEVVESWKATVV